MKKRYFFLINILFILSACKSTPESIPTGEWEYNLLVNGSKVGEATVSNKIQDNSYIHTTRMSMKVGNVDNITEQVITETLDFKPLKYEVKNKIIIDGSIQEMITTAKFINKKVELSTGLKKYTLNMEKNFIIDGNYFIDRLIKEKFKAGTEIKALIYEPMIETDDPISIIVKVIGYKKVKVNNREKELIHIIEAIENYKNVDFFINEKGITEKALIYMLNNRFELEKK